MREVPHECQYCTFWTWSHRMDMYYCRCERSEWCNDITYHDDGCDAWEQIPWYQKEAK